MQDVRSHAPPMLPGTRGPIIRPGRPGTLARLLLGLLLLVVSLVPIRSEPALATEQVPAASYRLDASVDLAAGTVDATEVVRLRNVVGVPLSSIVFRVVPNVVGSFSLGRAAVDGQDVAGQLDRKSVV